MKLLCTGDLHLGAGSDYGREPGERLAEQEAVWDRIVDLAIEQDVDALLHAGDVFERRRPTPSEMLAFARPLRRLRDHMSDILIVVGNHDVEAFDRPAGVELFADLVDVHREPGVWGTFARTSVCTLPWTPVANLVARNGGGDRDELHARAAELLLDTARDLRAQCPDAGPKILLLHWSVSGAALPTGLPTDTLREPVIPLAELEQLGFDAIVCGHIHKGQLLATNPVEPEIPIFYVGSPMPLNFGEANLEHGVWILEVDGVHGATVPEFVSIESRPFITLDLSGDSVERWNDAINEDDGSFELNGWRDVSGAIVKVRYKATAEQARCIDHAAIRQALLDAGARKIYSIEPSIEREQRARVDGVDEDLTPADAMHAYAEANSIDRDTELAMLERTGRYLEAVGS
jgi:DNA repair protein SbcD/Mre11